MTEPSSGLARVALTAAVARLLRELIERHGPVMFRQSGGCCDGSNFSTRPPGFGHRR
ncbi:DUF779 domain-containing protein [Nocardia asteroides]